MEKTYGFNGTCARGVTFERADDGKIYNIRFQGGCNGNLKGIASLCDGMEPDEIIRHLKGIRCGYKATSCPDQFAKALEKEFVENE
ncbi:MAG: TIGR03905 family TSCPD domain-containing protein [Eubacteriales bacterium]|nr:TIGR03905 family TSCPD domain-containing protein [Eubacteriales bacterium]